MDNLAYLSSPVNADSTAVYHDRRSPDPRTGSGRGQARGNPDSPENPYTSGGGGSDPRDGGYGGRGRHYRVDGPEEERSKKKKKKKRVLKLFKVIREEADDNETEVEMSVEAPPDGGITAWTVCFGSAVVNSANSVVNVSLHETVDSLNVEFNQSATARLNYTQCYDGLKANPGIFEGTNTTATSACMDLGIPKFYNCLFDLLGDPRINGAPPQVSEVCSYLWTSNPPPPAALTAQPEAARLVSGNVFSAAKIDEDPTEVGTQMNMIFVSLSLACILLAAILAVFAGYRVVSMLGSLLVAIGFLVASFLSTEQQYVIEVLVGGVAGFGSAFLRLAAVVAVLEYFEEKRMRAIVVSGLGAVLANFLVLGLTFVDGLDFYWRTSFRFQAIPAGLSLIAGLFLRPLALGRRRRHGQSSGSTSCSRKCSENIFSKTLFTNVALYLVLVVYLLDQLGRPLFSDNLQSILEERQFSDLQVQLQPVIENGGMFLGLLVLLLWRRHGLGDTLAVITGLNILVGILALHSPEMTSYAWAVVYSAVFGFTDGVFASVLQDAIPEGFGRQHIRIVAGILGFVAGVGTTASFWIGKAIDDNSTGSHVSMFFSGACLLGSGVLAFISRLVVTRRVGAEHTDSETDTDRDSMQETGRI